MVGKEKERPRERSSRYDYHRRHSSRSRDVGRLASKPDISLVKCSIIEAKVKVPAIRCSANVTSTQVEYPFGRAMHCKQCDPHYANDSGKVCSTNRQQDGFPGIHVDFIHREGVSSW